MIDLNAFHAWREAQALLLEKRRELQDLSCRAARGEASDRQLLDAQLELGTLRDRTDELFRRAFGRE